jgi:hypothetical protein
MKYALMSWTSLETSKMNLSFGPSWFLKWMSSCNFLGHFGLNLNQANIFVNSKKKKDSKKLKTNHGQCWKCNYLPLEGVLCQLGIKYVCPKRVNWEQG